MTFRKCSFVLGLRTKLKKWHLPGM